MEKATATNGNNKTERKTNKHTATTPTNKQEDDAFLSFSVTQDEISATENSRPQPVPHMSVAALPWCHTGVISQPREPEMSLSSRPGRVSVSPSHWIVLQTGHLSGCG